MTSILSLDYAGPAPHRSMLATCWRIACSVVMVALFTIVVILRATILALGLVFVFVGTVLLLLGGRRSAGAQLSHWRTRSTGVLRLWIGDIFRPLRPSAPQPLPAELA